MHHYDLIHLIVTQLYSSPNSLAVLAHLLRDHGPRLGELCDAFGRRLLLLLGKPGEHAGKLFPPGGHLRTAKLKR